MSHECDGTDFNFAAAEASDDLTAGVALAIVDHAFPGGEVARVVHAVAGAERGTVVLSSQAVDDRALYLGTAALDLDHSRITSLSGRGVLHVWADGRITDEAGAQVGSVDLHLLPERRTKGVLNYLTRRASGKSDILIAGIGRARLLMF